MIDLLFRRLLDISTGPYYMIGGGIYGQRGFIGCMRHITIDGNYKMPGKFASVRNLKKVSRVGLVWFWVRNVEMFKLGF